MVKASKRKRKQRSKDTPLSPNTKKARKDVIGKYALEVLDVRTSGKARTETYGATAAIIQKAQTLMPWIAPKMITSKAERLVTKVRKPLEDSTDSTFSLPCLGGFLCQEGNKHSCHHQSWVVSFGYAPS
jgi:regulator of protease activity HflC (stomatin/prohibitin superfamily)